jgi:hypothetical protein
VLVSVTSELWRRNSLKKKENFQQPIAFVISGFSSDIYEICALLGYYAASSGNPLTFRANLSVPSPTVRKSLPMFQDDLKVPSSRVKKPLEDGTDRLPRNVVKDYHSTLCTNREERRSQ